MSVWLFSLFVSDLFLLDDSHRSLPSLDRYCVPTNIYGRGGPTRQSQALLVGCPGQARATHTRKRMLFLSPEFEVAAWPGLVGWMRRRHARNSDIRPREGLELDSTTTHHQPQGPSSPYQHEHWPASAGQQKDNGSCGVYPRENVPSVGLKLRAW